MNLSLCPFCPLLCDDVPALALRDPAATAPPCPRRRAAVARLAAAGEAVPRIDGRPASRDEALDRAADLLAAARMPLLLWAGGDVAAARATVALAERLRSGLDVDRGGRPAADAVLRARTPLVLATLAEVRNRADLVLLFGTDGTTVLPRLLPRVLRPSRAIAAEHLRTRRIVRIGEGFAPVEGVEDIPCPAETLHRAAAVLRARVKGHRLPPSPLAGRDDLAALAEALRGARYAVVIWHAAELPPPRAEPVIEMLAGLVRDLNRERRAVALPLAGGFGGTLEKVALWQTGTNVPLSFADGAPDGEPRRFDGARLAAAGRVDLRLWIGAGVDADPPAGPGPLIALHHPARRPDAAVALPVAIPGIHTDSTLFRLDGVVALRARAMTPSVLPSAAETLAALRRRLDR